MDSTDLTTTNNATQDQTSATNWVYDDEKQQMFFDYRFKPTFKEAAYLNRTVYYSFFLYWTGKARELALESIGKNLAHDFASGDWGMVTNWAELNIYADVESYEEIIARFNIGYVYDSVIPLRCDFLVTKGHGDSATTELIASVVQETTWVAVIDHGRVSPEPFPEYLQHYLIDKRQQNPSTTTTRLSLGYDLENSVSEHQALDGDVTHSSDLLYQYTKRPGRREYFIERSFHTCLEDANLVGNVYYATYFVWQGRVAQYFLYQYFPEVLTGIGDQGELIVLQSRLDYLRDAMPFDEVKVCAAISRVSKKQIDIDFDFYRVVTGQADEKLAVSHASFAWRTYQHEGQQYENQPQQKASGSQHNGQLVNIPEPIIEVVLQQLNPAVSKVS